MRLLLALSCLVVACVIPITRAAQAPDSTLTAGLQTCVTNGIEAGVRQWYADRPELGSAMTSKVAAESAKLGAIIDSELVAAQPISKRVTRYYVALYFTRGPLWLRLDRYEGQEKSFYLPLKCSASSDDILPGYVTEFYH